MFPICVTRRLLLRNGEKKKETNSRRSIVEVCPISKCYSFTKWALGIAAIKCDQMHKYVNQQQRVIERVRGLLAAFSTKNSAMTKAKNLINGAVSC